MCSTTREFMGFHILLSNADYKVTGAALYDGICGHKTIKKNKKNHFAHDCLLNSSGSLGDFKFISLVKLVYEV